MTFKQCYENIEGRKIMNKMKNDSLFTSYSKTIFGIMSSSNNNDINIDAKEDDKLIKKIKILLYYWSNIRGIE
jgi:hypothetical protein